MAEESRIRVLTCKLGLDGHDVGVKVVSRYLADAGMEVIYTGLRQTPEMVVDAAIQEDVDAIGISLLSGAHMVFIPEVIRLLKERDATDIGVVAGGVIPVEDIVKLKEMGVRDVFPAGSSLEETAACIREIYKERQAKNQ